MVDNRQPGLIGLVIVLEPVATVSAWHRSTDESNPKSNQEKMNPVYTDRLVIRRPIQEDLDFFSLSERP
ncbi:hypothetical protein BGLA2_260077 [Burkholderia gladioli]|nr:hypothetical protein BGLA2_260077 [Burkholderia gladioli]